MERQYETKTKKYDIHFRNHLPEDLINFFYLFYTFRLTAVILTYNMKQQYDELEITLFNRLTGDHHKMPNEILLNKDDADAIKPLDEKRIKQIEKEIEITRNFTKQILEPRIGEEREKITKILSIPFFK